MKTILITAYAINPFKGSEDGTGWNMSREVAKKYKVIVITRENNIPHVEKYKNEVNDPVLNNMEFHGFDLPKWAMWWKKKIGERGYVLYYYLWQLFIVFYIKRKSFQFDAAHTLNFHSDNTPTFLWLLGKPTFWGPVGHHPKVERQFIRPVYSFKTLLTDRFYFILKWSLRNLDPFFRLAVWKTKKIFVINSSIPKVMRVNPIKTSLLPAVASETVAINSFQENDVFSILSVGRFVYMKGFDLCIEAFAQFHEEMKNKLQQPIQLVLVGKGEEKNNLQAIAEKLQVNHLIKWVEWVDRKEMEAIYRSSSAFLFPSHEGAGMVVPEAMSYGLPVVTIDNYGPGELAGDAGIKINYTNRKDCISNLAKALKGIYQSPEIAQEFRQKSLDRFQKYFNWPYKAEVISAAYEEVFNKNEKAIAVFHPSSELYGADRILVNAINAYPETVKKVVYLKFDGPLIDFIKEKTVNTEVKIITGLPVIYRKIFSPFGILNFIKECISFMFFIRKENKKYRFKSAYVNTLSCSFILPILSFFRIPRYIHVHEIIESPRIIGYTTSLLAKFFANKVLCVSNAVLEGMKSYVPSLENKISVLHNGILAVPVELKELNGEVKFYLFGRIMPKKGQWYLIEALSKIPLEELKGTRFVLMGGALRGNEHLLEELKTKITQHNLDPFVEIKDFAPNISEAMAEADICLVPSLMKDPFPTTVLEAMSAGRPVIATNHGGAKEAIIDNQTGYLVGPDQPEMLAETICKFIANKSSISVFGNAAKNRYNTGFTLSHFNAKWRDFLTLNEFV